MGKEIFSIQKPYKCQIQDKNKLTKFAISKYLKISRNRLNTLLKQLPPMKNEFDGKYYSREYVDKLKETFKSQINIKIDEFKKQNHCYCILELSEEFGVSRDKLTNLIHSYKLEMIKFGNLKFCSEYTKLRLDLS